MTEEFRTSRPRRRRRAREETEADLLAAAERLLDRDGVLAGINLREVATEADVNHGQIYQYFGTRRALLRAAVARVIDEQLKGQRGHWDLPFQERRRVIFRQRLQQPTAVELEALLALDGDEELSALPMLAETRLSLERDQAEGALPQDADAIAAHVMTSAAQVGYIIFRQVYARDTEIPVEELDERVFAVYEQMLTGIVKEAGKAPCAEPGPNTSSSN